MPGLYGFYGFYGWEYMLPALIISLLATSLINSRYNKYSKVLSNIGLTGGQVARKILDNNNLNYMSIKQVSGNLTDHFDPRDQSISLSSHIYSSTSIASIAVAAHEVGHAIQYDTGFFLLRLRARLVPITNIATNLSYYLIVMGLLINPRFGDIGVIMFFVIFLFQLVTLPVEIDASRRALIELDKLGIDEFDHIGSKEMLTAAALTYVSAMITALLQMLRVMSIFRRDD